MKRSFTYLVIALLAAVGALIAWFWLHPTPDQIQLLGSLRLGDSQKTVEKKIARDANFKTGFTVAPNATYIVVLLQNTTSTPMSYKISDRVYDGALIMDTNDSSLRAVELLSEGTITPGILSQEMIARCNFLKTYFSTTFGPPTTGIPDLSTHKVQMPRDYIHVAEWKGNRKIAELVVMTTPDHAFLNLIIKPQ